MKKTIMILTMIAGLNSTLKADTTLTYQTGNERHIVIYKTCDGVNWYVHKLVTVKPNELIKLRLKSIEGCQFRVAKHICKL